MARDWAERWREMARDWAERWREIGRRDGEMAHLEELDRKAKEGLKELGQGKLLVGSCGSALLLGGRFLLFLCRAVTAAMGVIDLADGHWNLCVLAHAHPLALRHRVTVAGVLTRPADSIALFAVLEEDGRHVDQMAVHHLEGGLLPEEVAWEIIGLSSRERRARDAAQRHGG